MWTDLVNQFFRMKLPYIEYWLPLAIGMGMGFMFLAVARSFGSKRAILQPPPAREDREYDPFALGSPTEQRKSFRRNGNPVEVRYALPDNKKNAQMGWVFDRSFGGVGLIVNDSIETSTVLAVLPANAPEMTPWIEVEVRSCRPFRDGHGFEIGCKFVKSPPSTVLMMFG